MTEVKEIEAGTTTSLLPWRRRGGREIYVPPSVRVREVAAEVQLAEHSVSLTSHALARRKVERELLREELELESDRIKGNLALAKERTAADKELGDLEAARLNPELAAGDTVRARRKELGLTQEGLARRSGVPIRRVAEIEAGKGGLDYHMRHIARTLDLDYRPALFSRPDREARSVHSTPGVDALEAGDVDQHGDPA
jgi:DNA-binding XRE family transcriptional regulator